MTQLGSPPILVTFFRLGGIPFNMLDTTLQDLRFTLRQLGKSKGFTLTAVMTVALAIGANTAIFTLVNAVMLKSLPVADPARLYRLGDGDNCCVIGGLQGRFSIYSYPLYTYLRDRTPEFEQMAAFQAGHQQVGVRRAGFAQGNEPFVDQFVSGNYFSLFGLHAYAGRLIGPADDLRGAPPVAVMSYRAWRQQYGSDPSVIGATFVIDGYPFTISGIAPPGFFGDTMRPDPPDFWMPLATEPAVHGKNALLDRAQDYWLYTFGRLKAGTPVAALEAKVNVLMKQWMLENDPPLTAREKREFEREYIALAPGGAGIQLMQANYGSDLRLLMAVTGLVLLIACANLANLLLARGAATRGAGVAAHGARRPARAIDPADADRIGNDRGARRSARHFLRDGGNRSAASPDLPCRALRAHRRDALAARDGLFAAALADYRNRLWRSARVVGIERGPGGGAARRGPLHRHSRDPDAEAAGERTGGALPVAAGGRGLDGADAGKSAESEFRFPAGGRRHHQCERRAQRLRAGKIRVDLWRNRTPHERHPRRPQLQPVAVRADGGQQLVARNFAGRPPGRSGAAVSILVGPGEPALLRNHRRPHAARTHVR